LCTVHHNFGGESRSLLLGPKKIFRQGNNNALVMVHIFSAIHKCI
jgi:hypothetical protein